LAGVLDGQSLCLTEKGDVEPVPRHKDFRIFAAMNPPTDVGKKELPIALRSRFTELYAEEVKDPQDLRHVVQRVLQDCSIPTSDEGQIDTIVSVYLGCRSMAETKLADGAGQRPRFSLRSLTRSLKAAKGFIDVGLRPLNRAIFEGFLLNFHTLLGGHCRTLMWTFLKKSLGVAGGIRELAIPPSRPGGKKLQASDWVLVKPFWLRTGGNTPKDWAEKDERGITRFVLTPTVDAAVRDLAAAVAASVAPILLQGPTSVGKTSMIEYLAARTGHKCVRINNHEHTDVQEYVGGYVTNERGHLEFRDGLLVDALRNGHWIILDELNLAPSDVLEALNRLLDDNKELLIPETGETVRPQPGFNLFATQNPPGAYGGRKPLSRAFRNRFLELNISDLPSAEIEQIVTQSCGIAPKFSKMMVAVMLELQSRRQQSSLFQGKYGAVTTRDLIKWGRRQPQSGLEVAEEGYMLLAEKLRSEDEKKGVEEVLNNVCKVIIGTSMLYEYSLEVNEEAKQLPVKVSSSLSSHLSVAGAPSSVTGGNLSELKVLQDKLRNGGVEVDGVKGIAITASLRRLWRLTGRCVAHNEPVLLIGETGCGKTMGCQLLAANRQQRIRILNCHQSTETSDIIGGLRPVRGRGLLLAQAIQGVQAALKIIQEDGTIRDLEEDKKSKAIIEGVEDVKVGEEGEVKTVDFAVSSNEVLDRVRKILGIRLSGNKDDESLDVTCDDTSVIDSADESEVKVALDELKAYIILIQKTIAVPSEDKKSPVPLKKTKRDNGPAVAVVEISEAEIRKGEVLTRVTKAVSDAESFWLRSKALFEWQDGPLVVAMKEGDIFVLDEINLAEDAVIERLNSVLESGREITLAEKGGLTGTSEKIVAHPQFKFLATMNPGGDFGKRELSPALRSRFTEIWIPSANSATDIALIVAEILQLDESCGTSSTELSGVIVRFMGWLNTQSALLTAKGVQISVREVLAWAKFVSSWQPTTMSEAYAGLLHGAHMVLLDGLGIGLSTPREVIRELKKKAVDKLLQECHEKVREGVYNSVYPSDTLSLSAGAAVVADGRFTLGGVGFSIPLGPYYSYETGLSRSSYILTARSVTENMRRILRAMQLPRPILLEGPPGVGKTSLVANLAALTGHRLVRINLSEHSEISDLLGSDLPAPIEFDSEQQDETKDIKSAKDKVKKDNTSGPKFVWCDGVFLTALKRGDWVLLDELNLAPQSVLEGLNACLDHRGEVFLPEVGQSFFCPPSFRVFCAQNPAGEGGGRKGLPQSFLTRFSRVFVEEMDERDMRDIAMQAYSDGSTDSDSDSSIDIVKKQSDATVVPDTESDQQMMEITKASISTNTLLLKVLPSMVEFTRRLQSDIVDKRLYGNAGAPWEFNLRDVFRWCEIYIYIYMYIYICIYIL
jgi:midasin (ATPase involved in ribosome maturation)